MLYPFSFTDIMGLERGNDRGICVEDIKLAMMGHINDGYTFNPLSQIRKDDQYYNTNPTPKDRVHVLVCVISSFSPILDVLSDTLFIKMREVRLAARDMGIPLMAILTKIDETCPEVEKDIKNVYKSKHLKRQMEKLSLALDIPLYRIFPVKNYHS
ncbi:interferon-induced protein 44-like, partial [Plectropomus leopardus]|uniref:interferon-induced protein 44-like n=1 Tax=Plectropomus leopardus TaxID=160734 RepID=UPI001C4C2887